MSSNRKPLDQGLAHSKSSVKVGSWKAWMTTFVRFWEREDWEWAPCHLVLQDIWTLYSPIPTRTVAPFGTLMLKWPKHEGLEFTVPPKISYGLPTGQLSPIQQRPTRLPTLLPAHYPEGASSSPKSRFIPSSTFTPVTLPFSQMTTRLLPNTDSFTNTWEIRKLQVSPGCAGEP